MLCSPDTNLVSFRFDLKAGIMAAMRIQDPAAAMHHILQCMYIVRQVYQTALCLLDGLLCVMIARLHHMPFPHHWMPMAHFVLCLADQLCNASCIL